VRGKTVTRVTARLKRYLLPLSAPILFLLGCPSVFASDNAVTARGIHFMGKRSSFGEDIGDLGVIPGRHIGVVSHRIP
jgi:hypothetical protein